jgi:hypothetical protein
MALISRIDIQSDRCVHVIYSRPFSLRVLNELFVIHGKFDQYSPISTGQKYKPRGKNSKKIHLISFDLWLRFNLPYTTQNIGQNFAHCN